MKQLNEQYMKSVSELSGIIQEDVFQSSLTESDLAIIDKSARIIESDVLFLKSMNSPNILITTKEVNPEIFETAKLAVKLAIVETYGDGEEVEDEEMIDVDEIPVDTTPEDSEYSGDPSDVGSADEEELYPETNEEEYEDDDDYDDDDDDEEEEDNDSTSITKEEAISLYNTLKSFQESKEIIISESIDLDGFEIPITKETFNLIQESIEVSIKDLTESFS